MADVYKLLEQISSAIYGEDVRGSIHDAIEQCYEDATGNPASLSNLISSLHDLGDITEMDATTVGPIAPETGYSFEDNTIYLSPGAWLIEFGISVDTSAGTSGAKGILTFDSIDPNWGHPDRERYFNYEDGISNTFRHYVFVDEDNPIWDNVIEEGDNQGKAPVDLYLWNDANGCSINVNLFVRALCLKKQGSDEPGGSIEEDIASIIEEVTDVKSDLGDITETVYSSNIFDQENTTITEGKYLNYNTGNYGTNESYCVIEDYIPVKAETQYCGSTWNKTTLERTGFYNQFVCFYDSNKTFISGLSVSGNPITTPTNCAYMRLSTTIASITNNYIMFEKGGTVSSAYVPYFETKKLKIPFKIVDINGNGDYTSIQDAIDDAEEDATIFIAAGVYEESVSTWETINGSTFGKRIHLIGMDKATTILKNTSQNYSTPPLEFSNGSIRNMTIYAEGGDTQTESTSCYAMHMETHSLYGKDAYFENCIFKSNVNYPIGIGLRGGGAKLTFKNCDFLGSGSGAGCIWFHDADASAYRGTCNLTFDGCNLICDGNNYPIRINAMHDDNLTYLTFKRNIVWAKTNETSDIYNTWNTGGVSGDGWRGLLKMYLTYDSVLNSESRMNYR